MSRFLKLGKEDPLKAKSSSSSSKPSASRTASSSSRQSIVQKDKSRQPSSSILQKDVSKQPSYPPHRVPTSMTSASARTSTSKASSSSTPQQQSRPTAYQTQAKAPPKAPTIKTVAPNYASRATAGPSSSSRSGIPKASTIKTAQDKDMASRQSKIETLPPAEREKQDQWAQLQLSFNTGACGLGWRRIPGAYVCHAGTHMVTDELLAEGMGGCYIQSLPPPLVFGGPLGLYNRMHFVEPSWEGPFYSLNEIVQYNLMRRAPRGLPFGNPWFYGYY